MSHQQWTAETGGWSAALSGLQLWFTHSNQSIWQPSSCWGLRESWGCHRPPSLPCTSCSSCQSSAMDKSPCSHCKQSTFLFSCSLWAADSQKLWVCTIYLRPFQAKMFFKVCELEWKMSQTGIPCEQGHCEFGLFVCFLNNVAFFLPPIGSYLQENQTGKF